MKLTITLNLPQRFDYLLLTFCKILKQKYLSEHKLGHVLFFKLFATSQRLVTILRDKDASSGKFDSGMLYVVILWIVIFRCKCCVC